MPLSGPSAALTLLSHRTFSCAAARPPCSTRNPASPTPQFIKGVADQYEELRQRQRAAMAEQMALDAESLRRLDEGKAVLPHAVRISSVLRVMERRPCNVFRGANEEGHSFGQPCGSVARCPIPADCPPPASLRAPAYSLITPAPPPPPALTAGVCGDASGHRGARRQPVRGPARVPGHRCRHW